MGDMTLCEHRRPNAYCYECHPELCKVCCMAPCECSSSSEQRPDIFDQMYEKEHGRKEKDGEAPTPRTDEAAFISGGRREVVYAKFARQLERELAEARELYELERAARDENVAGWMEKCRKLEAAQSARQPSVHLLVDAYVAGYNERHVGGKLDSRTLAELAKQCAFNIIEQENSAALASRAKD